MDIPSVMKKVAAALPLLRRGCLLCRGAGGALVLADRLVLRVGSVSWLGPHGEGGGRIVEFCPSHPASSWQGFFWSCHGLLRVAACAGGGCCRRWPSPVQKVFPGSSLFIGDGEDEAALPPVFSRPAGAPACRYAETEADDFPSATSPSSINKVGPAPGGSGYGDAAARLRPAPLLLLGQARVLVVISIYFKVLCNTGYPL